MSIEIGNKYNRLTVLEFSHCDKHKRKHYLCQCDCGITKTIQGSLLTSGNTKSCGCYGMEVRRNKLLPDNRGVINHIILQYKRHAKTRGYNWNLSYDIVEHIIQQPCFYCGDEKSNHKVTKNLPNGYDHNGIDRINNDIGYEPNNIVPCCKTCNYAKNNMSAKDFVLWIQKAAKHTIAMAEQWAGQA